MARPYAAEMEELADVLKANPGIDLQSAAKEAKATVAREQKRIAEMARAAEVKARRESFELFSRYDIKEAPEGLELADPGEPPSAADVDWMRQNKLCSGRKGDGEPPANFTHAQVLKLQRTAAKWRSAGFATFKQRRALNNAGIATPFNLSFQKAGTIITHLSSNNWRPNMQWVAAVLGGQEA